MSTLFHSKRTTAMLFLAVLTAVLTRSSGVDAKMDLLTRTMRQASAALLDDLEGVVGASGFPNAQRSLQDNGVCSTNPQDIFDDDNALQVHSSTYNPTCTCKETNALEDYEAENAFPESMEEMEAWLENLNAVGVVDPDSPPTFEESYDCSNQCSLCFENATTNDRYCAVASQGQENTAHIGFTSPFTLEEFLALGLASVLGENATTGADAGAEFEAKMMERVAAFGSSFRGQRCLNVLESSNGATGEICFIQEFSFSSEEGIPVTDLEETVFLQGDLSCSVLYQGEACNSCTLNVETESVSVDCANRVPNAVFDDFSNVHLEDAPGLFRPFLLFADMDAADYTLGTCDVPADSTSGSSSSSTSDSTTASSAYGYTRKAGIRSMAVVFLIPLVLGMW